jgi:1-acyl-sn-glycerol-3-phosphate acyltransferase
MKKILDEDNNLKIIKIYKILSIITVVANSDLIKYLHNEKKYWEILNNIIISNKIKYINKNVLDDLSHGVIIVSNHMNITDVLLIKKKINCHVVVKNDIFNTGYILNNFSSIINDKCGFIPYKRGNIKSGKIVKKKILNLINNNDNVLVFPEGTSQITSKNILPFKKGLFHIASQHNIPILPVVINYTVKFNSIVYPKQYKTVDDLIKNVHNIMTHALNDLRKI